MATLAPLGSDAVAVADKQQPAGQQQQQQPNSSTYEVSGPAFSSIIDASVPVRVVAERGYEFAHEAPVYLEKQNKLFFVSNRLGDKSSAAQTIQGQGDDFPPAVNKVNLSSMSSEVLLDSFEGHQFNSPNDVVFYKDGSIWFTDPPYGFKQNFRPEPEMGARVYAFNPDSGAVCVVADNFVMPNGIAFSPDFGTLYVTDTGDKDVGQQPDAQTIYAFDVVTSDSSSSSSSSMPSLENRRVFAATQSVKPDGIKVDSNGNVYTGTHEGVEVFAPDGTKLGRIKCGHVTNLAFVGSTLYCLCEKQLLAVQLKSTGAKLP